MLSFAIKILVIQALFICNLFCSSTSSANELSQKNDQNFNFHAKQLYDLRISKLDHDNIRLLSEYFENKYLESESIEDINKLTAYNLKCFQGDIDEANETLRKCRDYFIKSDDFIKKDKSVQDIINQGNLLVSSTDNLSAAYLYKKFYKLIDLLTEEKQIKNETEFNEAIKISQLLPNLNNIIESYLQPYCDRLTMFDEVNDDGFFNKVECGHYSYSTDTIEKKKIDFQKYPLPKANPVPFYNQKLFLNRLAQIEWSSSGSKHYGTIRDIQARYYYNIPIQKEGIPMYYFFDAEKKYAWPEALRTCLIGRHNIIPSKEFYDYVMTFPLDKIYENPNANA